MNSKFPKDFLWGGSMAGHQVEGGSVDQWSVWELGHAAELARTAKHRLGWLADWDKIEHQATQPQNYISGTGVNHLKKYTLDFKLAKSLNLNSLRFSVEWARVEPEEGVWDKNQWDHYRKYIGDMLAAGLQPVLNIWHWTIPTWFAEKGEFTKAKNIKYFERFVAKLCDELNMHKIKYVITLNEPNVYASFSYITGEWVPNEKKPIKGLKVYWNLVKAHRRSYKILKAANPKLQVGIAAQLANIQAKRPHHWGDQFATKTMRYAWNWWFLRRIRKQQDFIGFNYYFTDYYRWFKRDNPKVPLNDLGWYMEPEGLYPLILRVWARFKKPMMICENGVADSADQYRRWWLEETMIAMQRAMSEGAELKGYFHWSLLDNFEWKYGWWPKFGLIHVNRAHGMTRTVRPSAKWWASELKKLK